MARHRADDPLSITCPVCRQGPDRRCLAVDMVLLPGPHPERVTAATAGTPTYDTLAAS